jgi:hypothetical protein
LAERVGHVLILTYDPCTILGTRMSLEFIQSCHHYLDATIYSAAAALLVSVAHIDEAGGDRYRILRGGTVKVCQVEQLHAARAFHAP